MIKNRRRSVLIAENDRACAQMLKFHLERAGFMVYVAYDGEQAAILAARQRFELIFANLDLPIINGAELRRHVREDLGLREIPFALCADASSAAELEDFLNADDMARVFYKPIDPKSVVEFAQETVEYLVSAM